MNDCAAWARPTAFAHPTLAEQSYLSKGWPKLKIDSKWKAVALRLAQEFWLPALIGCVWCWVEWDSMDSAQSIFKQLFKNFAAGLFFGSFFVGNIVRVARQQFTEGRLLSHSQKLDSLANRLERRTDELIHWMMGGSSQLALECKVSEQGYFSACFRHDGKFPIYDLEIEVSWGHASLPSAGSGLAIVSDKQPIKRGIWPIVLPGDRKAVWDEMLDPESFHVINIDGDARNGSIRCFVTVYHADGEWTLGAESSDWKPRTYATSTEA